MPEYTVIVSNLGTKSFCDEVNAEIKDGWRLQGGVCSIMNAHEDNGKVIDYSFILTQAMIRGDYTMYPQIAALSLREINALLDQIKLEISSYILSDAYGLPSRQRVDIDWVRLEIAITTTLNKLAKEGEH
jgi:hypothetical protein